MKDTRKAAIMLALTVLLLITVSIRSDKPVFAQTDNQLTTPDGKSDFLDEENARQNDVSLVTYRGANNAKLPRPGAIKNGNAAVSLAPSAVMSQAVEIEPNGTPATATPIGNNVKVKASNIYPNGDIDFYSFTANAGDRVYIGVITSFSAGNSTDSQLTLLASDGATVIENDNDNGSFAALSSSIAGAVIPASGTYYIKMNDFTAGTTSERPYDLYLQVQTAAPTPETEPNDTPATANAIPASGHVSGTRNPATGTEQDWYSISLNAGDTIVVSLDLDPERDLTTWNGRLGIGLFGDATDQIVFADDAGSVETPGPTIPSEFAVMTVKNAGTYYAVVDSASAAIGGPTATYNLSVSVSPRVPVGVNCTTYTSTDVPKTIGPANGLVTSTLTVPGSPVIASVRPFIQLNHALMNDNDVQLRSPAANDNGLFTDIGAAAIGGQTLMDLILDDDAGLPPSTTALRGVVIRPELNYRLGWFRGENAGGTWNLDIRDDTNNASGGTLTGWGLEICEQPAPLGTLIYSEDFESSNGGYTHSGAADEWEYGTPATLATTTANPVAAITTCNSGVNCWKTDLDNTYNINSNQDLVSSPMNLTNFGGTITLSWAMRYQMESANFDHLTVSARQVGNPASARILWQWLDATMTNNVGNPAVNIGASAGWATYNADISDFAGSNIEIVFHVDTDNTVNFAGPAIDDVKIFQIGPTAANVSVGGRVLSSDGRPLSNARVVLSDSHGNSRTVFTGPFGYYGFEDVPVGQAYVLSASLKRYRFDSTIVTVGSEIANLDIIANPDQ
jgi:subtilisin-like proprotein convertase family protein